MKLINHIKGNHNYDDSGAVMSGTIEVSPTEWQHVKQLIKRSKIKELKDYKHIYLERAERPIRDQNEYMAFSLGVTVSKLIAKKYNLKRYKRQNYQFKIVQ